MADSAEKAMPNLTFVLEDGITTSKEVDDSSDDSFDSDEEAASDDGNATVPTKDLLRRICADIHVKKRDLTISHQLSAFSSREGNDLARNKGSGALNALHLLVAEDLISTSDPKVAESMRLLVRFLVQHPNKLLETPDQDEKTPLFRAIEDKKEKVVEWMCEAHSNIDTVLAIPNNNRENCMHLAIQKRLKFLRPLIKLASGDTLAAKDRKGNLPLHYAVEHRKCRKDQMLVVEEIVSKCDSKVMETVDGDLNAKGISPYIHHRNTCQEAADKKKAKEEKNRERVRERGRDDSPPRGIGKRLVGRTSSPQKVQATENPRFPDDRQFGRPRRHNSGLARVYEAPPPDHETNTELHARYGGSSGYGNDDEYTELPGNSAPRHYSKVEPLAHTSVWVYPPQFGRPGTQYTSVRRPDGYAYYDDDPFAVEAEDRDAGQQVPYEPPELEGEDSLVSVVSTDRAADKHRSRASAGDPHHSKVDEAVVRKVERFLKLHYLRSRSLDACMEILNGRDVTSDVELYFDLSGRTSMKETGLVSLLSRLKFEDILQYVAIPNIRIEPRPGGANSKRDLRKRDIASESEGRQDLVQVFESLRKKGVKTILKVVVDDSLPQPHSDEAIENALRGMDVEVWDWRRIDLSSEVIYNAAPKVREVHLHWSGNNAVIQGWSDEGGLKKLKELKRVYLYIHQGLETSSRTRENAEKFTTRMGQLCPRVKVEKIFQQRPKLASLNAGQNNDGKDEQTAAKHEWLECMRKFRTLLITAEHTYRQKRLPENIEEHIKIALIDDGVDVTDPNLPEGLELSGRTFCTRNGHGEHNLNHPYYASGAGHGTTMAKQIYSMCPSAQLYVLRLEDHPSDDGRTRQLDAKSAARAIRAAVQKGVHIISMSWTILPPEDAAVEQLLDQAVKAADQANILMFCSASDKGVKKSDTYPAKGTNRIFTIGAAKASGIKEQWVGKDIDFTFPGYKVPQGVTTVTGSSVATALAAGLAALVLYCVQVRLAISTAEHEREKARRQFRLLRRHENMHRAFGHSIGTTEGSEYKFLAVWDVFGKACEKADAAPAHEDERLIEFVAEVGSALCMKLP